MARITLRDECVSMKWKTPKTTNILYMYYMCIFIYMRSFTQLCIYFTIFIRIAIYLFTSEVNRASWENSDKLKQKIGEKKHENWTSTVSDGDRDRQRLRMAKKMKMQRSKEKYTQPPTDNTNCLPLKSYITNKIETRWKLNSSCKMDVTL